MRIFNSLAKKVGDLTVKYSNFPESYIKRSYEQVYWKNPEGYPQYRKAEIARKKFRFTTNRPWTAQFRMQNERGTLRKKVFLEPIANWSFFKGDRVQIMVGKDKGKQGIVSQVIQERNWVIVEGMNTHLRTVGREKNFPGVTVQSEAPLLVTTDVKLVDPESLKPTEIEWRFTEEGDKVRVSKASSRIIPIPKAADETYDFKSKELYIENKDKDTSADDVTKVGREKNFPGVTVQSEAPLLVTTDVKLVDPESLKPTEIEWRFTEEGDKVRVSKASSRIIPIPKAADETYDFKSKELYIENKDKDTSADDVTKVGREKNFPGVTVQSEAPLLVTTDVKLVDPESLKPTEIEWRFTEEGDKVRVSKASSRIIQIPKAADETYDFKSKELYIENKDKDTSADDVTKVGREKNFPGVTVQSEAPLLVTTDVKLVDPESLKPTEIEWRFTEEGDKVRVSKASSRIIPIPKAADETYDFKSKELYIENKDKDTSADDVTKITFSPKLATFEMDVMESMGIKEDRVPAKSYWY